MPGVRSVPGNRSDAGDRGPVAVLDSSDPVAAFAEVARRGGAVALPTSGTSGAPRMIVRSARSWTDSFPAISELTRTSAASRVWLPGPLSATMNLFAAVHARWAGASRVDGLADATHLHLTPSRLRSLLDEGAELGRRTVVVAGDALDAALRERAERAGAQVAHYYGAAELSFVAWGRDRESLQPFPAVEIDIRDGGIWVRSPYLADGYLTSATLAAPGTPTGPGRPAGPATPAASGIPAALSRPALIPRKVGANGSGADWERAIRAHFPAVVGTAVAEGPLRIDATGFATVGDRGRLDGDRLVVDGRPDTVITGGATVLITDVEAVLRPMVRGQLVVVGLPHPRLGQIVAAVLTDSVDRQPAQRAAADLGPGRPRRWYVRSDLPLTPAGKVDRLRLTAELAESAAAES